MEDTMDDIFELLNPQPETPAGVKNCCPYCESRRIVVLEKRSRATMVKRRLGCGSCDRSWTQIEVGGRIRVTDNA